MHPRRSFSLLPVALAFVAIAACHCKRTAVQPGDATAVTPQAHVEPSAPTAETPAPEAAAPVAETKASCAAGMTEVTGNYCTELRHWCLEGYPTIGSNWTKYYPTGAIGVEYCEKYVVGKAECVGKERPLHYCIDTYEQPGKGQKPTVMVSWYQAEKLCEAQGRRLCQDDEWTLACEGNERTPYPYGWERDETACNIGKALAPHRDNGKIYSKDPAVSQAELDRLDLRVPSGSMPRCVSPFGVYDLTGNADEWCRDVTTKGASLDHAPFVSVFKGGHMLGKVRNRCRPATTAHGPDFYYHVEGFRCCATAK
jgi:sulfatase modifying factor 1